MIEEYKEERSPCKLSFKEKIDNRPFSTASASYCVSKAKTWQAASFANNANKQINAGRAAAHNVIQQSPGPTRFAKSQCSDISDIFILFSHSSLRKT